MERKILLKRIIMSLAGVFGTGVDIAMYTIADFGMDPFASLNMGLCNVSKIPYGIVFGAVTAILLIGVFVIKRSYIGIATVLNMFFVGTIAEKFMGIFKAMFPEPTMSVRLILLVLAVILNCFSASLYFTADLGVSGYDAWALILAGREVAPFRMCRIGTDVTCVVAGAFMGVMPGAGTVIAALGVGPLIEFFNNRFSVPFLKGELGLLKKPQY